MPVQTHVKHVLTDGESGHMVQENSKEGAGNVVQSSKCIFCCKEVQMNLIMDICVKVRDIESIKIISYSQKSLLG